jgi:hypothetical protein
VPTHDEFAASPNHEVLVNGILLKFEEWNDISGRTARKSIGVVGVLNPTPSLLFAVFQNNAVFEPVKEVVPEK